MSTTFSTTQLDFNSIKDELKTYLSRQSEFADYDFEASGLSNILDVLAYNTHFNALLANFALNEAYISSAQLRSSLVSIAQTLGYNIRSRTSSSALVEISLNLQSAGTRPASITLPSGTKFTTSVNGVSYTFQTRAAYSAADDGTGIYDFVTTDGSTQIPIYEGVSRTKTFIVQESDERQIYVIPDETMDTQQMMVDVYDTYTSSTFTSYTNVYNTRSITLESTFYRINETPNSYYELSFGDGITLGQKPVAGNKVEVEYLSTSGPDANGAVSFTPVSQINVNGDNYDILINTVSSSVSGALKQSDESIRQNAPLSFAAQNRLVTADDYKTTVLTNYSSIKDAVAWGGEDHDPPNYGVVYMGLLFNDGTPDATQSSVKSEIKNDLNENLAMLSIDVDFIDPVKTYLNIETNFSFNPDLVGLTRSIIETQVFSTVKTYVEDNLNNFSGTFRKSAVSTLIDEISPAVLSSEIDVTLQQRLTPITVATELNNSQSSTYTIYFPVVLAEPDDENFIVTSTGFDYNGITSFIKNKLSSTKLQVVDVNNNVVVDNIGSYEPTVGKLIISGFAPGVILSGDSFIKINVTPLNDNVIKPLRNYYLDIDETTSFASAIIDRQTNSISL